MLELSLQLGDGAAQTADVRVFVELRDSAKVLITPRYEIFDASEGLYRDNTTVMPDEDMIYASVFVTDTGGTNLSPLYNPATLTEVYLKDITGQLIEDNLDAQVSSISGGQDNIEGTVNSDEALEGEIENSSLIAEVSSDTILEGEIKDEC